MTDADAIDRIARRIASAGCELDSLEARLEVALAAAWELSWSDPPPDNESDLRFVCAWVREARAGSVDAARLLLRACSRWLERDEPMPEPARLFLALALRRISESAAADPSAKGLSGPVLDALMLKRAKQRPRKNDFRDYMLAASMNEILRRDPATDREQAFKAAKHRLAEDSSRAERLAQSPHRHPNAIPGLVLTARQINELEQLTVREASEIYGRYRDLLPPDGRPQRRR